MAAQQLMRLSALCAAAAVASWVMLCRSFSSCVHSCMARPPWAPQALLNARIACPAAGLRSNASLSQPDVLRHPELVYLSVNPKLQPGFVVPAQAVRSSKHCIAQ